MMLSKEKIVDFPRFGQSFRFELYVTRPFWKHRGNAALGFCLLFFSCFFVYTPEFFPPFFVYTTGPKGMHFRFFKKKLYQTLYMIQIFLFSKKNFKAPSYFFKVVSNECYQDGGETKGKNLVFRIGVLNMMDYFNST